MNTFASTLRFMFIPLFQARKLYRSMVLEKKRAQAATIIAAYYTGWKVNMLHVLNTAGVFLVLLVFYFRFPVLM